MWCVVSTSIKLVMKFLDNCIGVEQICWRSCIGILGTNSTKLQVELLALQRNILLKVRVWNFPSFEYRILSYPHIFRLRFTNWTRILLDPKLLRSSSVAAARALTRVALSAERRAKRPLANSAFLGGLVLCWAGLLPHGTQKVHSNSRADP